jgi:hypothetical protein
MGDINTSFAPLAGRLNFSMTRRITLDHLLPLTNVNYTIGDGIRIIQSQEHPVVSISYDLAIPDNQTLIHTRMADLTDLPSIYLRMYEHRGSDGQVLLDYTLSEARLAEVDLAGRELSLTTSPLQFRPWQIKTVRIEPSGK